MDSKNKRGKTIPFDRRHYNDSGKAPSLLAVGHSLVSDPNVNKILDMILERALEYTFADSGSIYLVDQIAQDSFGGVRPAFRNALRFHKSLNVTQKNVIFLVNQLIEINPRSIVGYVACTGCSLRVRDCYSIPSDAPYSFNPEFDRAMDYHTVSTLSIPIKTSQNSIIGVVQLINKTRPFRRVNEDDPHGGFHTSDREVVPFSENDERLIESFASHAAIALENAKLTEDIAKLFESFVTASVTAIEARDPTTSGHSDRVAALTVRFAEIVDAVSVGEYAGIKFTPIQIREIRYAALLHDFGKIGVRENVLLKAQKLYPHELETVLLRLDTLKHRSEAQVWRSTCEKLVTSIRAGKVDEETLDLGRVLWSIDAFHREVEEVRREIMVANESQILDKDFDIDKLMNWLKGTGQRMGCVLLTDSESKMLSIRRGTLGNEERLEIQSHVSHTYEFLRQIHWTDDLARVPEIAHAHHEKLDGTGYPRNLKAEDISVQSRMMAISDIYDALTAMDRPYKKAVSTERAIEILHMEADDGKLDQELLRIFIENEIFKAVHSTKQKYRKTG